MDSKLVTITGQFTYAGNPCITEPCLPGMIYAVIANGNDYFITVEGSWYSENRKWDEYTPQPGDIVKITGYLNEQIDIRGDLFFTIEAVSLKTATR